MESKLLIKFYKSTDLKILAITCMPREVSIFNFKAGGSAGHGKPSIGLSFILNDRIPAKKIEIVKCL